MRTQDVNQPLPNVGIANKTLNANQLRPYLGYGIISNREQSYASQYNGLQVELSRRFARGFTFKADYTWSKALDTTDCCSGNIYNFYPDTQNAHLEWGRSSMDAEHNFIAYYVYELPFLRDKTTLAGKLLGGSSSINGQVYIRGSEEDHQRWVEQGRAGGSFAGRAAASALQAVGLPELVASSLEEYGQLALELACDSRKLRDLRQRLTDNRTVKPLFDTVGYTRRLEAAFRVMHQRAMQGLAPEVFDVAVE